MWMLVFVSGKYAQGDYPLEMVKQIAADYDPEAGIEAPCVIGHFENLLAERVENELASGWVKSLMAVPLEGGMGLMAELELSSELIAQIKDGRLRYVSVELAKVKDDSGAGEAQPEAQYFVRPGIAKVNTGGYY